MAKSINWQKHKEERRLTKLKNKDLFKKPCYRLATEKQRKLLDELRIDYKHNISLAGASDLIDKALGKEKKLQKEDMRILLQEKRNEIEEFLKNKKIKCD